MSGPLTATGALRAWYSIAVVLLASVLVAIGCVLYTGHTQAAADRRWCQMLALQATPSPSPSTPRGVTIQTEARRLAHAFGCPK